MLQLNTWLKLRGHQKYEEYWTIYPYKRVQTLLEIWGGPWIPHRTRKDTLIITKDFDGRLIGSWRSIQAELERMDLDIIGALITWENRGICEEEKTIIENIRRNVMFEVGDVDRVKRSGLG